MQEPTVENASGPEEVKCYKRPRNEEENNHEAAEERSKPDQEDPHIVKKLKTEENSNHETSAETVVVPPQDGQNEKPEVSEQSSTDTSEKSQTQFVTIVANHYNAVPEVGLSKRDETRILYMRNFNNWIKSQLIDEYLEKIKQSKGYQEPIKILDMCSGKGGDLRKWAMGRVNHVIFVDIADKSVEDCRKRYQDMNRPPFNAEFLIQDCTKVRLREKYQDPTIKLDLVSCQFAFHYCFESLPQAECMLRNASEVLDAGKYFIGTIPNAYELVSRWRKAESNTIGNEVYNIEFLCDKQNPPLFGAKYKFNLDAVVDCPEFLVYPKVLEKLALKFGLKLIVFKPFSEFFEKNKDMGRSLLRKMSALEDYPPKANEQLKGNLSDYQVAADYMQRHPDCELVGTISKAEWEAITLYAVFAFKKLKHKWNAEGKAEYILED